MTLRNDKTCLYAGLLSVLIHLVFFFAIAEIQLANPTVLTEKKQPSQSVQTTIKKTIEHAPLTRKPKVRRFFPREEKVVYRKERVEIETPGKIEMQQNTEQSRLTGDRIDVGLKDEIAVEPIGSEFFGQFTALRKICYVVDCSASMSGMLGLVTRQLKESIWSLKPDQYFYIIFFQDGDKLLESGSGKMIRATEKSKAQAMEFISKVRPSGRTNAVAAIKRAMQITDSFNNPPQQIYFLTDGFELEGQQDQAFAEQIENMRISLAPLCRINTIGFWTEVQDVEILRSIAASSGGEFTNIDQ